MLEDVLRDFGSASGGANASHQSLATDLMGMLSSGGMSKGLGSLVSMFTQKGFGDEVNSWVSTGKNLPISADSIESVLGSSQVQSLAAKAGINPQMASTVIAQILPMLVDRATPDGRIPSGGLMDTISGFFRTHQA
jgi:uncharacterized protein YidB (DUF937 family)